MTTPHKHSDAIHAWADGAEIENQGVHGDWTFCAYPLWAFDRNYRIKPELVPNVVTWHPVFPDGDVASGHKPTRPKYNKAIAILCVEINYNDPANPVLVSATLEKP